MTTFKIYSLPTGNKYMAGIYVWPDQHIHRARNPGWPGQVALPTIMSKYTVRKYFHNNRPYFSRYDLLWLFILSAGPAAATADKENFYLSLTAVYGRWCWQLVRKIGSRTPNGVGDPLFVFQCTWNAISRKFSLGASLAGIGIMQ